VGTDQLRTHYIQLRSAYSDTAALTSCSRQGQYDHTGHLAGKNFLIRIMRFRLAPRLMTLDDFELL